jgi:hypothetical protein
MRNCSIALLAIGVLAVSLTAHANPILGTYTSAFRPGPNNTVLTGRASVSRQFPNSGNPKMFNGQSWNGTTLGTQWEIRCGVEQTITPPDYSGFNSTTGTGLIIYHQVFSGGTFALYAGQGVNWGEGTGTLSTTTVESHVFLVGGVPQSSSFTATTAEGHFDIGCTLTFAMANGFGVGETSDPPYLTKPATYPAFLAANCTLADASHQFGAWVDGNDITVTINPDCTVPAYHSTWGSIKSIYR